MKKTMSLVLLIVLSTNLLFAQAPWMKNAIDYNSIDTQQKEYKLVNTQQLDETVNDIFYSLPNENGLREPGIILKYSIKGKSYTVIDNYSKKNIKSDFKSFYFYVSDNLKYFGREVMVSRSFQGSRGESVFELYQLAGTKLFHIKFENNSEVKVWDLKILNNGYVLMINHMGGIIKVLDRGGNIINEKDFIFAEGFDRKKGFTIKDTKDSKYIALNVTDRDTANNTNYGTVYLVDLDLNVLYKKPLLNPGTSDINVSNSGNVLVFSWADKSSGRRSDLRSYIVNITEKKIYEYDDFFMPHSTFYDDFVMVFNSGKGLKLIDVNNGGEIFKYYKPLLAYDYAPEAKLVFTLEGRYRPNRGESTDQLKNVRLKILNLDGKPVFSLDLGTIDYKSRGRAFVSCTNDASKFILKVGDNIYTYEEVN